MTAREKLLKRHAELRAKYPPAVYGALTTEPEDVLAYVRDVVRFERTVRDRAAMEGLHWNGDAL